MVLSRKNDSNPPSSQYIYATPDPNKKLTWPNNTNPPVTDPSQKPVNFQLDTDLLYWSVEGKSVPLVYKEESTNGLLKTIRLKDIAKLNVYNSNIQLLDQPDFSNIPKTPLDYRKKAGTGLSLDKVKALARTHTLAPIQQELIS